MRTAARASAIEKNIPKPPRGLFGETFLHNPPGKINLGTKILGMHAGIKIKIKTKKISKSKIKSTIKIQNPKNKSKNRNSFYKVFNLKYKQKIL